MGTESHRTRAWSRKRLPRSRRTSGGCVYRLPAPARRAPSAGLSRPVSRLPSASSRPPGTSGSGPGVPAGERLRPPRPAPVRLTPAGRGGAGAFGRDGGAARVRARSAVARAELQSRSGPSSAGRRRGPGLERDPEPEDVRFHPARLAVDRRALQRFRRARARRQPDHRRGRIPALARVAPGDRRLGSRAPRRRRTRSRPRSRRSTSRSSGRRPPSTPSARTSICRRSSSRSPTTSARQASRHESTRRAPPSRSRGSASSCSWRRTGADAARLALLRAIGLDFASEIEPHRSAARRTALRFRPPRRRSTSSRAGRGPSSGRPPSACGRSSSTCRRTGRRGFPRSARSSRAVTTGITSGTSTGTARTARRSRSRSSRAGAARLAHRGDREPAARGAHPGAKDTERQVEEDVRQALLNLGSARSRAAVAEEGRAARPAGARVRAGPLLERRRVFDRGRQRADVPDRRAGRPDRRARRRGAGAVRPRPRDGRHPRATSADRSAVPAASAIERKSESENENEVRP